MTKFKERARATIRREHVADVEADDLTETQARSESEGDDRVVAEVARRGVQDGPLFVDRQSGWGQMRHRCLLAAQVRSVGEEVKALGAPVSPGGASDGQDVATMTLEG